MNNALKLAVVAGIAGSCAVTAPVLAGPKVYGRIDVSINHFDDEAGDFNNIQMKNNDSRLGVKGTYQFMPELAAIYKLEYAVDPEDSDTFKQRNIYGGFKGNFGTVFYGFTDTPLKVSGKNFDVFNDVFLADIKNTLSGEERLENSLHYQSNDYNGFGFWVAVAPGEESGEGATDQNGLFDRNSIAAHYKNGGMKLTLAYDRNVELDRLSVSGSKEPDTSIIRFTGSMKFGAATVAVLAQQAENSVEADRIGAAADGDAEATAFGISGKYKITSKGTIKAQFVTSSQEANGQDVQDLSQISLGYDHKLADKVKLYAYGSQVSAEPEGGDSEDETTIGLGARIKF